MNQLARSVESLVDVGTSGEAGLLAPYDRARVALAEARVQLVAIATVGDAATFRAGMEHLKLHARQIRDRALLVEATELQLRAERKLGALLIAAKEAGELAERGRPKKSADLSEPATYDEIGLDRRLAAAAQKAAGLAEEAFEEIIDAARARIASRGASLVEEVNGHRAVMASRLEADDSLDYFPTPPWATRALIERVFRQLGRRGDCARLTAGEPACGEGHIAEVLREYFAEVAASDVHGYGYGRVVDFLTDPVAAAAYGEADWIITNPPFAEKAEAFVLRALELARVGVAMFLRLQWLETEGRYERIFREHPPTLIAFFAERVNLCRGRWDPEGGTATAYIWLVWVKGAAPRAPYWIPPGCKEEFSRSDDVERFTAHPVAKRPLGRFVDNATGASACSSPAQVKPGGTPA